MKNITINSLRDLGIPSKTLPSSILMSSTQNSFFSRSSANRSGKQKQGSTILMGKSVSNSELRKRMTDFLEKKLRDTQRKSRTSTKKKSSIESSDSSKPKISMSKTASNGFFGSNASKDKTGSSKKLDEDAKSKPKNSFFPSKTNFQSDKGNSKFSSTFSTAFPSSPSKFSINIENLRQLKHKLQNERSKGGNLDLGLLKNPKDDFIKRVAKPSFHATTCDSSLQTQTGNSPLNHECKGYYLEAMAKACGENNNRDYIDHLFLEHLNQALQAAKFADYIDPEEPEILEQIEEKKVFLPNSKFDKTIVFDLDETLVHCNDSEGDEGDAEINLRFPTGELYEASINFRPFYKECLKELSKHFELILFTASHSCYGEPVTALIDPNGEIFSHKFFRDSCITTENGIHVKDLRILANRDLCDIAIVDNSNFSFSLQPENGVPILPFYDYKADNQLKSLTSFLISLESEPDIRRKLMKFFALHELESLSSVEEAQKFSIQHFREVVNNQM